MTFFFCWGFLKTTQRQKPGSDYGKFSMQQIRKKIKGTEKKRRSKIILLLSELV